MPAERTMTDSFSTLHSMENDHVRLSPAQITNSRVQTNPPRGLRNRCFVRISPSAAATPA